MTKIKICGLFRDEDIQYVNEAVPDYAGFIINFPKSHRNLTIEQAATLRKNLSYDIKVVTVFVNQPIATVLEAVDYIKPDVIQLHGDEGNDYIDELKQKTALTIWKAFKVDNETDFGAIQWCSADEILLDNGYGTGTVFNWSKVEGFTRSYILAGGLTPENIGDAINKLHPSVVDLSSGVETDRIKDRDKILAAVKVVRER